MNKTFGKISKMRAAKYFSRKCNFYLNFNTVW